MNLEHVIKISGFILPVNRINQDGSIIIQGMRYIPGKEKIVYTDNKGKIRSVKVK